jgi:hypothetical protein
VRVLERDLGLAEVLSADELVEARRLLVTSAATVPRGDWKPPCAGLAGSRSLGLLVLDGLVTREVGLGGPASAELIGPGDLIRPWDVTTDSGPLPLEVGWRVLEPTTVAVLGAPFGVLASQWPALTAAFVARATRRAQTLAVTQAIACTTGIERRLLMLLWHLADRWGRVGPDGTSVPLRLTHETIGQLIAARRPSVSSAMKSLERQELVRRAGHGWLLTAESPDFEIWAGEAAQSPASELEAAA